MTKDSIDTFLSRYEQPDPDAADPAIHMSIKDAEALQDELAAIVDPLPLHDMDPAQRDASAGKRFPEIQEVMLETAAALRRCPEILADLDPPLSPEALETAARQDMSIGGFIRALSSLAENADTGLLLAVGEAAGLADSTADTLKSTINDTSIDPDRRRALGFLFADAVRVHSDANKDAQGRPAPGPSTDTLQALSQQRDRNDRRLLVQQFLSDLNAGRAAQISKSLLPAANHPRSKAQP